jgi:hypothetical protein
VEGRTRGIPGWHELSWDHVERMRIQYKARDAVRAPDTTMRRFLRRVAPLSCAGRAALRGHRNATGHG